MTTTQREPTIAELTQDLLVRIGDLHHKADEVLEALELEPSVPMPHNPSGQPKRPRSGPIGQILDSLESALHRLNKLHDKLNDINTEVRRIH